MMRPNVLLSLRYIVLFVAMLLFSPDVFAYICDKDEIGPLSVVIEKMPKITEFDTAQEVKATFKNTSDQSIIVQLSAKSIEQVQANVSQRSVTVPAKGSAEVTLQIVCGPGTYSAHYPVHLFGDFEFDGQKHQLHPVQVFATDFGTLGTSRKIAGKTTTGIEVRTGDLVTDASQLPLVVVPKLGGVSLVGSNAYRVTWRQFKNGDDAPFVPLNVAWQGADEQSRTSFSKIRVTRGGVSREAFSVHPPYNNGAGTMFSEHLVTLPETKPIFFSSYVALRDLAPSEPPSDGVTFAVWVGDEKIGEKHTTGRTWEPLEVDLSRFAGQTILLRLQSDPGPKHDTTCDSAFWGTPLLFAGERPKILTPEEKAAMFAENLKALQSGGESTRTQARTRFFRLENDMLAAVTPGNYGFLDGVIGIGSKNNFVQYDGLCVEIEGQPLGTEMSALACEDWKPQDFDRFADDGAEFTQKVVVDGKQLNMTYYIGSFPHYSGRYPEALQLRVECSEPLAVTKVNFGPATHHANRVYFGHGYCITEPERFEIVNGGHSLSTSHVGFDFDNGISLLMATTFPPDRFIVDPDNKTYTLSVCNVTTMTLLPGPCYGSYNALHCAIRYRPLYDKQAAPGVAKKAGRFVFDVWGGQYADHTRKLQQQIDYGVTDALFVNHNWQRWGYDNRLPDIWPPNPRWGTYDEMRETLDLCRKHGILYGLHDNYIDIYPDADDFNYDVVSFNADGRPRKAWNNYGIDAQSYQFRPDRFMPFLERNFKMMMPEFPQTANFVDVFASIHLHDFWDRDGNKHGQAEMLDNWCKAFDRIREHLGDNNPTISEAGSDFLIGHLDGADCQFLMLSAEPGDFRINIRCKHWARVPWFDAVNHTRFSLHGVGYDSRYVANRGNDLHGYMSDDYMSTEVLTGHALQVGWNTMGRESIRKYWLLQPVMRNLANAEIEKVFLNKHDEAKKPSSLFPCIFWNNGTRVLANQGKPYRISSQIVIPQYGFTVFNQEKTLYSGILSLHFDNEAEPMVNIIELSDAIVDNERRIYFNPRQVGTNALPVMPAAKSFEKIGGNQFNLTVDWNVFRPLKGRADVKNFAWFLHLEPPRMNWHEKLELTVLGGGMPETPVSEWESNQSQNFGTMTFPDELGSGTYNVLIGLWDADGNRQRAKLLGPSPDNSRILLGKLKVEKRNGRVTKLEFLPENEDAPELFERLLPTERHVLDAIVAPQGSLQHYPLRATGGVQLRYPNDTGDREILEMTVTPLPEEPASTVVISLDRVSVAHKNCDSIIAIDREGKKLRDVEYKIADNELRFDTQPGEFAYKIVVRK